MNPEMTPLSYHDRVNTLFENAQQLFKDMQAFSSQIETEVANRAGVAQTAAASVATPEPAAAPTAVEPVAAAEPATTAEPAASTSAAETDPSQLVAGIDLDALLRGSNLTTPPLQP